MKIFPRCSRKVREQNSLPMKKTRRHRKAPLRELELELCWEARWDGCWELAPSPFRAWGPSSLRVRSWPPWQALALAARSAGLPELSSEWEFQNTKPSATK